MANAATERKQIKELTDRLETGIQELLDSEKFKAYLTTMSRFYNYSARNSLLIYLQKPDATHIASFRAWDEKFNRHVKKGEKGIRIFAPSPFKKKIDMEKIDPVTQKPALDSKGQIITEMVDITIPSYKAVPVFDISQTDGEPLPELVEDLNGSVERYELFMDALREISPLPIVLEKMDNQDGYCEYGVKIAVREDMSEIQTVCAAIHEIAHAKLHDRAAPAATDTEPRKPKSEEIKETEAEGVSYTVCQHYGIETGANSFGYLAEWGGGREMKELQASLDTIRTTAAGLIDAIDVKYSELAKERGIDLTVPLHEKVPEQTETDSHIDELPLTEPIPVIGLEISEAKKILGYWWALESQNVNSSGSQYNFARAGVGKITLYTNEKNIVVRTSMSDVWGDKRENLSTKPDLQRAVEENKKSITYIEVLKRTFEGNTDPTKNDDALTSKYSPSKKYLLRYKYLGSDNEMSEVYDTKSLAEFAKEQMLKFNIDARQDMSGQTQNQPSADTDTPGSVYAYYSNIVADRASAYMVSSHNLSISDEIAARQACDECVNRVVSDLLLEHGNHHRLYRQFTENPDFKARLEDYAFIKAYLEPKNTMLNTKTPEHTLYGRFDELFPRFMNGEYRKLVLKAKYAKPLELEWVFGDKISIMHSYELDGQPAYEPCIMFNVNSDKKTLTASSFELSEPTRYDVVYGEGGKADIGMQQNINNFMSQWLDKIEKQEFMPVQAVTEIDGKDVSITFDAIGTPILPESAGQQEVYAELEKETEATLLFYIDADMKLFGTVTEQTLEAIAVQGYEYRDGKLEKATEPNAPVHTPFDLESTIAYVTSINAIVQNAELDTSTGKGVFSETINQLNKIRDDIPDDKPMLIALFNHVTESVDLPMLKECLPTLLDELAEMTGKVLEPELTDVIPDPLISISDMKQYGYTSDDMLPLTRERAIELFVEGYIIYTLNNDNTEEMVFDIDEIITFDFSGIFGIERSEWQEAWGFSEMKTAVNNENPLAPVEKAVEQNYNKIDGVINNEPTVADLKAVVDRGEQINLLDLAKAGHHEREQKKTLTPKAEAVQKSSAKGKPSLLGKVAAYKAQIAAGEANKAAPMLNNKGVQEHG